MQFILLPLVSATSDPLATIICENRIDNCRVRALGDLNNRSLRRRRYLFSNTVATQATFTTRTAASRDDHVLYGGQTVNSRLRRAPEMKFDRAEALGRLLTFDCRCSGCEGQCGRDVLGDLLGYGRRFQRINLLLQLHKALSLSVDGCAITLRLYFHRAQSHHELRVFASRHRREL